MNSEKMKTKVANQVKTEKVNIKSGNKYDELKALWCEVFGDEPEYVDALYNSLDATGRVCVIGNQVVSALTTFDVGELDGRPIACIYAVCTVPEYRGNGYASELVRATVADIEASGKSALVSPASPTLQNYYAGLGFAPACYAQQKTLVMNEQDEFNEDDFDEEEGIFIPDMQIQLQTIDAATYGKYREKFLGNSNATISEKNPSNQFPYSNHIILSRQFLDFILSDSYDRQGMLLVNGGDAICVLNDSDYSICGAESSRNNCVTDASNMHISLTELIVNPALAELSSEIDEQLAIGMAELLGADSITYRVPANSNDDETYVQSMLSGNGDIREHYFGFPMD